MRLWSGTQVAFGEDGSGPSVIVQGDDGATVTVPGNEWQLDVKKPDGTRIWRPLQNGKLERIKVPCPDQFAQTLTRSLEQLPPAGTHPAISDGLEKEALRLYPQLDAAVAASFTSFVVYLRAEFELNEAKMLTMPLEAYADGFGPELLVLLNDKPVLIPEVPPVWLAPDNWHLATWRVTNGMIGPITDETLDAAQRWQFTGDIPLMNITTEGLVYYQAARAMLAWAAWENDTQARFVQAIIQLVLSGYRPLHKA